MPSHIFVSHSSADKELAQKIVAALEAAGIRCWIAPRDIQPGSNYAASIIDGIDNSRGVIFVVSEHLNASHQVPREAERAVSKNIPVLPVRVEEVKLNKSLEYFFSSEQWFDAFPPPLEKHLKNLAESVRHLPEPARDTGDETAPLAPAAGVRAEEKPLATAPAQEAKNVRAPILAVAVAGLVVIGGLFFIWRNKGAENHQAPATAATPLASASPGPSTILPPEKATVAAQSPAAATTGTPPAPVAPAPATPHEGENFVVQTVGMPKTWVAPLGAWVGTHEVTQEEFARGGGFASSRYPVAKRPVDSVSWNDAMKFCASLNRMEKQAGRLPAGWTYTLPTDEQWRTYVGDSGPANAVFGRSLKEGTAEVGSMPPNVFGLYDVLGNIWQWTLDWHPEKINKERAPRGGSFASQKSELMLADERYSGSPSNQYYLYGFRCVLVRTPSGEPAQ